MKKNILLFSIVNILAIVALVSFTSSRGFAQATQADPPAHSIILHVNGMMCHDCEQKVENALKKVKGVSSPHASSAKGVVILKTSGKVSTQKLIAAVKTAGFTATVANPAKSEPKAN